MWRWSFCSIRSVVISHVSLQEIPKMLPRPFSALLLLLHLFLSYISTLSSAPPPGCVLPHRVSTVTIWIWSTVNVSSHSSWIIKQHFLFCLSHYSEQQTPWIFSWLVSMTGDCLRNHYFIKRWLRTGRKSRGWFIIIHQNNSPPLALHPSACCWLYS